MAKHGDSSMMMVRDRPVLSGVRGPAIDPRLFTSVGGFHEWGLPVSVGDAEEVHKADDGEPYFIDQGRILLNFIGGHSL